jgi:hypothetical protein
LLGCVQAVAASRVERRGPVVPRPGASEAAEAGGSAPPAASKDMAAHKSSGAARAELRAVLPQCPSVQIERLLLAADSNVLRAVNFYYDNPSF